MNSRVHTQTLHTSAVEAVRIFRLLEDGPPDLIDIGLEPVRNTIGGFFPGTLIGIAMATGVGKSSLALTMLREARHKGGYISTEDPPDVLGARIVSAATGIDSLRLRRKDLTPAEQEDVAAALDSLEGLGSASLVYPLGASLDDVEDAVEALAAEGCRWAVLDYLQKVRGAGDDRRNEVGRVMTGFQRACHKHGMVAVLISQLVRMERTKVPQVHHLKESGDIENECRVIVLGHVDEDDERVVRLRVAKSTFGGHGARFTYRYDESGTLRYEDPTVIADGEDF